MTYGILGYSSLKLDARRKNFDYQVNRTRRVLTMLLVGCATVGWFGVNRIADARERSQHHNDEAHDGGTP